MPSSVVAASGAHAPAVEPSTVRAFFFVTAPADPGLLSRVIEPVAKLGTVPTRVHATRESGDGSEVTVDLRLAGAGVRCSPRGPSVPFGRPGGQMNGPHAHCVRCPPRGRSVPFGRPGGH